MRKSHKNQEEKEKKEERMERAGTCHEDGGVETLDGLRDAAAAGHRRRRGVESGDGERTEAQSESP